LVPKSRGLDFPNHSPSTTLNPFLPPKTRVKIMEAAPIPNAGKRRVSLARPAIMLDEVADEAVDATVGTVPGGLLIPQRAVLLDAKEMGTMESLTNYSASFLGTDDGAGSSSSSSSSASTIAWDIPPPSISRRSSLNVRCLSMKAVRKDNYMAEAEVAEEMEQLEDAASMANRASLAVGPTSLRSASSSVMGSWNQILQRSASRLASVRGSRSRMLEATSSKSSLGSAHNAPPSEEGMIEALKGMLAKRGKSVIDGVLVSTDDAEYDWDASPAENILSVLAVRSKSNSGGEGAGSLFASRVASRTASRVVGKNKELLSAGGITGAMMIDDGPSQTQVGGMKVMEDMTDEELAQHLNKFTMQYAGTKARFGTSVRGPEITTAEVEKAEALMSKREKSEILDMFNLFDTDGSGTMDPMELRIVMRSLGFHPQREEVEAIARRYHPSNVDNCALTLSQFYHVISQMMVGGGVVSFYPSFDLSHCIIFCSTARERCGKGDGHCFRLL
jgi:hypothetical protein